MEETARAKLRTATLQQAVLHQLRSRLGKGLASNAVAVVAEALNPHRQTCCETIGAGMNKSDFGEVLAASSTQSTNTIHLQ